MEAQVFIRFALQLFSRYNVENWKRTICPQTDLEHLDVESILYKLNTSPQGPNFTPFHTTIAPFQENCNFGFPYIVTITVNIKFLEKYP